MKKLFIVALIPIFFYSCSTVNSMDAFYNKYEKQSTVIAVPKIALTTLSKLSGNADFVTYLKSAKFMILTNSSNSKTNRVIKDLKSSVRGDHYSLPVKLTKGNKNLNVAMLEDKDRVKSVVLGVSGFNNVLVVQSKVDVSKETLNEAINKIDEDFIDDIIDLLSLK